MKTYIFRVKIKPDDEGWRAFYPPLEEIGASTWGATREEAIRNIREVLTMILEEFLEEGKAIPVVEGIEALEETLVAVNV